MNKTMRVAAVLAALTMMSVPAFAQAGGGGQGGGRQGGGGFGGGQFGRGGGELTVVQVPVAVLAPALKLTADQTSKIKAMQDKLDAARKAMRPAFGGNNGTRPSQEEMQQMMEDMRAKQEQLRNEETKNGKAIEAMLTPDQATALKAALPSWKIMQQFGLLTYAADLNLTPAQMAVLEKAAKERAAMMQGGNRRGGGN